MCILILFNCIASLIQDFLFFLLLEKQQSFEMCLVPILQLHLHGVRMRQINGDAWNFDLSEEYVNSMLCYLMAKCTNAHIT